MDRHPTLTSLLTEHSLLSEEIRLFVLSGRRSEDDTAQSLRNRASNLLSKANKQSYVFPEAELDTIRHSCNAILAELQPRTDERCAPPSSPSHSPLCPPSLDSGPSISSISEFAGRCTHLYAMLDTESQSFFGFLTTPEPISDVSDWWRERLSPDVELVKLPSYDEAIFSSFEV
ncbi:hypothetical protein AURDEDRAFT_117064 [Auricularia subglabra TFB-10046 SS5]|nr:hypothetical protein AURDEDRAFT_117064 [Auricularia subglabra TFB-10046 SS5]